jgi:hypothetical protein
MATLKLAAPLVALLVAWFATSAYCVTALATVPASLGAIGAHQPVRAAPPAPVPVSVS